MIVNKLPNQSFSLIFFDIIIIFEKYKSLAMFILRGITYLFFKVMFKIRKIMSIYILIIYQQYFATKYYQPQSILSSHKSAHISKIVI